MNAQSERLPNLRFLKDIVAILLLGAVVSGISLYFFPAHADVKSWQAHADRMEVEYSLPPGLLRAICTQETRWRNVAGRHGEIGLCQIKPATVAMVCPECVGNVKRTLFALGSRGDHVLRIQVVLARGGHYTGRLDGIYGPQTQHALLSYQRANRLKADGITGPRTWEAMFGAHDPYPGTSIVEALWDPYQNIEWAARYLVWLRDTVADDPAIMMAAYNGGPANPVVIYMKSVKARM